MYVYKSWTIQCIYKAMGVDEISLGNVGWNEERLEEPQHEEKLTKELEKQKQRRERGDWGVAEERESFKKEEMLSTNKFN